MSSSLASMNASGHEIDEVLVYARLDAEREEIVTREPAAFYCILLGHQHRVALVVLELAGGVRVMVRERVRDEGETERFEGREEPLRVADSGDRVQPLAAQRLEGHARPRITDATEAGGLEPHRERIAARRGAIQHHRVDRSGGLLPERSCRQKQAIAVPPLVLDRDFDVSRQPIVLEAVVADQ